MSASLAVWQATHAVPQLRGAWVWSDAASSKSSTVEYGSLPGHTIVVFQDDDPRLRESLPLAAGILKPLARDSEGAGEYWVQIFVQLVVPLPPSKALVLPSALASRKHATLPAFWVVCRCLSAPVGGGLQNGGVRPGCQLQQTISGHPSNLLGPPAASYFGTDLQTNPSAASCRGRSAPGSTLLRCQTDGAQGTHVAP